MDICAVTLVMSLVLRSLCSSVSPSGRTGRAEIDSTGAIAEQIAQDKELTKRLLHAAGVPVPLGREVKDQDDAWACAQEIGLPVVLKPKDGNQGKGVTVNISTRAQLDAAFASAAEFRDDILVERYLPGNDFRLLVIGDSSADPAYGSATSLDAVLGHLRSCFVCSSCCSACCWLRHGEPQRHLLLRAGLQQPMQQSGRRRRHDHDV